MADLVITFIITIIYLNLLVTGLRNDLASECVDTRNDCSKLVTMCNVTSQYYQIIISGCKKSCGLCSDTRNASRDQYYYVKLKPQIKLNSINETGKDMKVINVSCTLLNDSHMNASLDFKCYSSKSHFQNITGANKTLSTHSLEIHIPSTLVSINCSCTVLLYYDGQVTHLTTSEQLFVRLQEKPAFYITSSTENGTNITVNENETVSFTCLARDKNQIVNLLNWADHQIIIPTSQAKSYIESKTVFSYQSYIITQVQCKDAGVYHCVAVDFRGEIRSTVQLFVQRIEMCREPRDCRANFSNIIRLCSETTSWDSEQNSGQGTSSVSIVPIAVTIASAVVILLVVFAASKSIRVSKNPTVRIVNDCLHAVRTVCVTWCPESRDGNKLIKPTASRTHGCKVSDQGQVREGTELEPKPITHLFASVNDYDIQSLNSEPNVRPNGNVYKSSQLKKGMLSIVEISRDEPHSSEGLFYAHLDFSNAYAKANCPLLPLEVTEYGDIDFRTNLPAIQNETF